MNRTNIEWVKNPDGTQGYTWNPITGCLNGCEYCYARKLANTRLKERYLANSNWCHWNPPENGYYDPFYPRFWPDKLEQPFTAKPKGIFTCDMSDLFGIGIPEDWTKSVLEVIKLAHQHRFYLLTKQPQNLQKFSPFPDNCYVGVSCSNEWEYTAAYTYLPHIDAKVRFLSIEPLLGRIPFEVTDWAWEIDDIQGDEIFLDWIIIGAQTKPYNPPKIEWLREIVEAAGLAGIPVFLKNNLKPLFGNPNYMVPNIYKTWWGECNCFGVRLRQELLKCGIQ